MSSRTAAGWSILVVLVLGAIPAHAMSEAVTAAETGLPSQMLERGVRAGIQASPETYIAAVIENSAQASLSFGIEGRFVIQEST